MKPAPFAYHNPRSLAEAVALLGQHRDEARILAGGQSLVPMMNMRIAQPAHVIDINGLHELAYIRDGSDQIAIGALTRHDDVARSALVRTACPLLAEAAATVGHYAIRQRGTLGGSLAHADPAAQLPLVAAALDAAIDVVGPGARRTVVAHDFFLAMMTTALGPDEIVVEVRFPKRAPREGSAFEIFSRRRGDFALAAAAATVTLDDAHCVLRMRLGIGGVHAVPATFADIAQAQRGQRADARWCGEVAAAVRSRVEPEDSRLVPSEYRRDLCEVLTRRALERCLVHAEAD